MLWIERVLVGFLAFVCELSGLDSERLAELQRRERAPRSPAPTDIQTIHRLR